MKRDVIEYLEILFGVYLMDVKIIGEFFSKSADDSKIYFPWDFEVEEEIPLPPCRLYHS